jgi:iron complex transport system ATP-binding protein
MATVKPIVSIKDLSFSFGNKKILNEVSVDIPENKLTILLGRNGSGKSTLLRLISGLLHYHSGSILINGHDLKTLPAKQRAGLIGFLPQKHKAVFPFLVKEVVMTGRAARIGIIPSKNDHRETEKIMDMTGISYLKNRIYSELSGGEQQLVMITRTLAQQPNLLLLDEPISHLDYNNQISLLRLLKKLVAGGITIVAVIHDPNLAFLFGEHFLLFNENQIWDTTSSNPWDHEMISKIFRHEVDRIAHKNKNIFIPRITD